MESFNETFGPWQGYARTVSLVPATAASYDATDASFAGVAAVAATGGLGQSKPMSALRTHNSIRPGSPPRGRLR